MQQTVDQAIFFSISPPNAISLGQNLSGSSDLKETSLKREEQTTNSSQEYLRKASLKSLQRLNNKADDSYLSDLEEFVKRIPQDNEQDSSTINMSQELSPIKRKKNDLTAILEEKKKYEDHSNWLSQLQLKCVVEYSGKRIKTICKIKDAELQFENGGYFRLTKITKMKVLFEKYEKGICFTYDEVRGKKTVEIKFRVFLEQDTKEDLYSFFAKVIVEKLLLFDYPINLKQTEDPNADKFMMTGELLKKGQIINQWNRRKMILTDRIESFKGSKCTFQMKNIKEIWTRLQTHDNNLIIKIRHGWEKTELAIPMVNYRVKFCKDNWLYRIYLLLTA